MDTSDKLDKNKSSRATVRKALREERAALKQLKIRAANGESLSEDIEACKGQIELLFRELKAIEEGGHTTFLEAKENISPKKNVSEKKNLLRQKIDDAKSKIKEIEKSLDVPNLSTEDRDARLLKSSKARNELEELQQEYNALLQYNHTNFVNARNADKEQTTHMAQLESLQNSINKIKSMMIDSADKQDFRTYKEQESQLSELENKLKNLTQADTDFLLETPEEDSKEDPFLEK